MKSKKIALTPAKAMVIRLMGRTGRNLDGAGWFDQHEEVSAGFSKRAEGFGISGR